MIKILFKKKNFLLSNVNNCFNFFSTTSIKKLFDRLIPLNEFKERQKKLVEIVNKDKSTLLSFENLILVPAACKTFQAFTKIPNIYFKQNSNFVYLTGLNRIDSSNCFLVIFFCEDNIKETILFHPVLDDQSSIWEGDGVKSNYLNSHINSVIDSILDYEKFDLLIKSSKVKKIFLTDSNFNDLLFLKKYKDNIQCLPISSCIDKLRLIKSENELNAIRRTCNLGTSALNKTINWTKNQAEDCLINEKQIEAVFDFESKINGATKMAYPPVIAGNDRAVIIHYGANSQNIKYKDWILMDAGCEDNDGYNSDITRSWQINKVPNKNLQFYLYQALYEVQKKLISSIIVGQTSLNSLFEEMGFLLIQVLKEFSILDKASQSYSYHHVYPYCPHHVSHFLGLDIHDSPSVDRHEKLRAGMCFTIEPGLYFRNNHLIPKEFKGIGLRIEDNIIINYENKVENLTKDCYY